ncbi:MAG: glycerol-3-phosphate dehydrogenase/oxidase [Dechloromonas sp.]|nr:MAG: glycerol-3-phosphate dehydrogenase/oxidase [Dechloromonas sp.]
MNRAQMLGRLGSATTSDIVVIGGGATGLGIAVDAASRGHRVALLERGDFAEGTSSRSTKLIHGGVRYLQQGRLGLVREALRERGRLLRNAPHLVRPLPFVVPAYRWWEQAWYGIGLGLYDLLAGTSGVGPSFQVDRSRVVADLPNIAKGGLRGGVRYLDGQFDDAALALALAHLAAEQSAVLVNYCPVVALRKEGGRICGVDAIDQESGETLTLTARVVINATGPFSDAVRRLDTPQAAPLIAPSQGVHLVLPGRFLGGDSALLVPRTPDGRVIFLIPWHGRVLVGTTDTPVNEISAEPRPQAAEIEFLLSTANRYLAQPAGVGDILSVFAGIRPLICDGSASSAARSREHWLQADPTSGLITVAGGKWTTYRQMAEDTVNLAEHSGQLITRPCRTASLAIPDTNRPTAGPPLHPALPLTADDVRNACREGMARRLSDVLVRRRPCLLLDAAANGQVAPQVAALMAETLGRDATWIARELSDFERLVHVALPTGC